jgi:hypothetical protein
MATTGIYLTNTITKLELFGAGNLLATATGFFLKLNERWYLVTNWHVLSGRDPQNGQSRHPTGAVPDVCRFYVGKLGVSGIEWNATSADLGDVSRGTSTWFQHPQFGQAVDVAVLPITLTALPLARDLLEMGGHDPDMFIDLGGELFLPGFPLGFAANGLMPIWKRASLASSLEFGHSMDRYFYVDTATREGMSGAPCLAISNWRHYAMDRATTRVRVVERPLSWRLLGVYSGRHNPSDTFEAQIGIVWRETLIFDAITAESAATVILNSSM